MVSRRTFLAFSATALTAPWWSRPPLSVATQPNFTLEFANNSGSDTVFGYVTGTSPDGRLVLLKADGTAYYPPSPAAEHTPLPEDCAIPLGPSGAAKRLPVPKMAGARVYLVTGDKLDFFLNPGPALVHPSFLSSGDPNYQKNWTYCEFTYNDAQLYANISYVDFVATPLSLHLTTTGSGEQTVSGLPAGSLDPICAELAAQAHAEGSPWDSLIETASGGGNLRVLSPHYRPEQFTGYLDGYLDQVWQKYSQDTLTVDSQDPKLGKVNGRVAANGLLTFDSGDTFGKPSTADVWSCDSGPFAIPAGAGDLHKSIIPRLAAALNRTTLLANPNQPDGENPADFYRNAATNHYARIVHARLPDNRGYAFPYDDVSPSGGQDFSGAVHAGDPEVLTVTVKALR